MKLDEDAFDCDNFIEIPHKNDLDLGERLVFNLQPSGRLPKVQRLPGAEGTPSELVRFREPKRGRGPAGVDQGLQDRDKNLISLLYEKRNFTLAQWI